VSSFEGGAHDLGAAGRVEGVVDAPLCLLDEDLLNGLVVVVGVDAVCRAKLPRHVELGRVRVNGVDRLGLAHLGGLDDTQPDGAQPKHSHRRALLDVACLQHRPKARADTAPEQRDLVQGRVLVNLCDADLSDDSVLRERRTSWWVARQMI
jgi:hypothetical protein